MPNDQNHTKNAISNIVNHVVGKQKRLSTFTGRTDDRGGVRKRDSLSPEYLAEYIGSMQAQMRNVRIVKVRVSLIHSFRAPRFNGCALRLGYRGL